MAARVPIVAFVGKGDSGKTTVVEKVVRELSSRGWRVATVKHHVHDFEIDVPGKDSFRHSKAGSVISMVSAPDKFAVIRQVERELTLDEIAANAADADILIAEGFKRTARERIEVSRRERSEEYVCGPDEVVAVVTDHEPLAGVVAFGLEDAAGIADFIELRYLAEKESD